ncbi:hypothetical protein [Lacticaseibacillus brantae]|uniref:Uncharacterized protein n=1 Tax=Lacticaseibacillus brantae DSM 23927 TaxID=1423727 RepID=A0A0R2B999_9LACO|nr:hypothetical protein [Lacticaseibacillus brantae]KRM72726.1 hypothetical protein FC34_GL000436 [Lacticaseibacillus brantae DSM 23927]
MFKRKPKEQTITPKDYDFSEMVKAARVKPTHFKEVQKVFSQLKKKPRTKK